MRTKSGTLGRDGGRFRSKPRYEVGDDVIDNHPHLQPGRHERNASRSHISRTQGGKSPGWIETRGRGVRPGADDWPFPGEDPWRQALHDGGRAMA